MGTPRSEARAREGGAEAVIRPIRAGDDAVMAEIVRTSLRATGLDVPGTAYFDPELDRLSAHYGARPDRRRYLVACDPATGRILGGAGVGELEGAEGQAELQKLYVAEGARRRGLGGRLVRAVVRAARGLGYRELYLETHSGLAAAARLYERLGFRRCERAAATAHTAMDRFYLLGL